MSKPTSLEEDAELERDCLFDPKPTEPAASAPAARGKSRRVQRLQPLPGPYVRAPIQWMQRPDKPRPASPEDRLFFYLLYKSHWGQKEVRVTNELAAEIGVPASTKRWALGRLVKDGVVRVVRREEPSHVLVVIPLVHNAG
jgi:hypothetical protein